MLQRLTRERPLLRHLLALSEMNIRELGRDPVATFFSFLFPLLFLVLFGLSDSYRRPVRFQLGLAGSHPAVPTARLAALLRSSELVAVRDVGATEGRRLLDEGALAGLLVVTRSTGEDAPPIRLVVDPRWSAFAVMALDAARGRLGDEEAGLVRRFEYRVEHAEAAGVSNLTFVFPGLIALAMLQLGLFATAAPLLRARDRGTLRLLSTTPVSRVVLGVSQILPRFVTASGQLSLLLVVGAWGFDVEVVGGWLGLSVCAALGALMLIAIGYALAGIAPSVESGLVIVLLVNFGMLPTRCTGSADTRSPQRIVLAEGTFGRATALAVDLTTELERCLVPLRREPRHQLRAPHE